MFSMSKKFAVTKLYPMESVIKSEIGGILRNIIRVEYMEQIKKKLTEKLADTLTDDLIDSILKVALDRFR